MNSGRAAAVLASVLGSLLILASVWLFYKSRAITSASLPTTARPPPLKRLMVRQGRTIPIPDYRPPSNTSENASSLYHSSWYLSTALLPRHVAAYLRTLGKFKNRSSHATQDLEEGLPAAQVRQGVPPVPELPTSQPQTPHPSPCNTPSPHNTRSSAKISTIDRDSLMKPLPELPIQRSATTAIGSRSHHKQSSLSTRDRNRPSSTPLQAEVRITGLDSTFLDTSSEEDMNAISGRQSLRSKFPMETENGIESRHEPRPRRSASTPRPALIPILQCETDGTIGKYETGALPETAQKGCTPVKTSCIVKDQNRGGTPVTTESTNQALGSDDEPDPNEAPAALQTFASFSQTSDKTETLQQRRHVRRARQGTMRVRH